MASGTIRIDARMLGHSGIGVVIENFASRWIRGHADQRFQVLLHPANPLRPAWLEGPNVHTAFWDVPIYSIREHFLPPPRAELPVRVTWCPHYNVSLALGGPVVATIHDVLHLDSSVQRRSRIQRLYAATMFRVAAWKSKGISFDSEFTRSEFVRLVGRPRGRNRVVHLGVDDAWSRPVEPGSPPLSKPYVVFVGNAFPHKNLARLIGAMRRLRRTRDVDLVVVGKNDGLKNLDRTALELVRANSDFIHALGKIPFEDMRRWIDGAKAMVFPTLYEGFGLPPLEALASGIPVVVSDIPVLRELYSGVGHFVDPREEGSIAEGIAAAMACPMSAEARRAFARGFDWDESATAVYRLLEECASPASVC